MLAIQAKNIFKQSLIDRVEARSLNHDISRIWFHICGIKDACLKIGKAHSGAPYESLKHIWFLKYINCKIKPSSIIKTVGYNEANVEFINISWKTDLIL